MEENNQVIIDIGIDALIASLQELQKQYEANTAAMKALRDEGKQDSDEYIQLAQANKVLRQEMGGVEKSIQNNIKAEKAQEGSLIQLRAQLANLNKQYDSMSGFERMGTAGEALRTKIKALSDNISELEANTGRYQRNVGNYKSALEGLSGSFKLAGLSTNGLDKSLKLLNANPIMLFLTAIVSVVRQLIQAFKGNEEATMALEQAFSAFNPFIDAAKRGLEAFANTVVKVVTGAVNGLTSAIGWLLDKVQDIGDFFGADWHMGDNFREGVKAANELQAAENDYIKAKRAWSVESAKIDRDVSDLRAKAADKEKYTAKERAKFLDEAIALETKKVQMEKDLAQMNLDNLRKEAERSANDAAMNDKLAEAERAVIEADTKLSDTKKNLNKERQSAIEQGKKEIDTAKKYADLVATEMANAEKAIISLIEDEAKKRIALENNSYEESKKKLQSNLDYARKKYGEQSELYKAYASQLESLEKTHAKALEDIERENSAEAIKIQEDVISRQLALVRKGTTEEFALRRELLGKKKDEELFNEKLTAEQRLLIERQYQYDLQKLDEDEAKARQDKESKILENRIEEMKQAYQKTGELELQLLQQNIDNLTQLQGESDEDFYARRLEAQKAYNDKKKALDDAEMAMEKAKADYMASIAGSISSLMESVADDNKEMVKASKIFALAEVAIKQGVAIAEAVAASAAGDPYTYALRIASAVASTVSAMASAIASINKASFETGGVIGGYRGATMGSDNTYIQARRGEMVLNADQQRQLFDIANGNTKTSIAAQLAEAIQAMPAPVLVYEEFSRFGQKIVNINELTQLQ